MTVIRRGVGIAVSISSVFLFPFEPVGDARTRSGMPHAGLSSPLSIGQSEVLDWSIVRPQRAKDVGSAGKWLAATFTQLTCVKGRR